MYESERIDNYYYHRSGFELEIPPTVMIPSAYTELLFDGIPSEVNGKKGLDLGCGCGLLAIKLAHMGCRLVVATDINPSSILATRSNANINGVCDLVDPVEADMFLGLPKDFDIIVFNPPSFPSLTSKKLRPNFYAGKDGRKFIDLAIKSAKYHLSPGGVFVYIQNSLSNFQASINLIEKEGYKFRVLSEAEAEFREEYYTQLGHLSDLRSDGCCEYEEREGKAYQKIYVMELRYG